MNEYKTKPALTPASGLKPLPFGAKKSQVFKMYPRTPERMLRSTIHHAQKEINPKNLPEEELIKTQWVNQKVLQRIIEIEGPPAGYEPEFRN